MSQTINNRIQALRALLKNEGIQAFIIPSTDPHLSEYVAPHWNPVNGFQGLQVLQGLLSSLLTKPDSGQTHAISCKPPNSWKRRK